ncbi:MAG: VWA domain-containing protein [Verrucomicrobiota bacterium]
MTVHFIRPIVFLAVPILALLWWLWRRAHDPLRGWRSSMDPELLEAMMTAGDANQPWRGAGLLIGWLLAVLAIAGPTWKPEPSPFADAPSPVMILLKADESMNREDFIPSRMERARLKAADFCKARNGQPLGLIAYAGSAHLVMPPTRDTAVIATMAQSISPKIMPEPGNNLSSAIKLAEQILHETGGSILVIADSVPEVESTLPVHLLAVAREQGEVKATLITADSSDIETLIRKTEGRLVAAGGDGETRWAEAGYWLVPVLGIFALLPFRRTTS